jgi:zinc protease
MLIVGAAPHLPAGILSPYNDGERDAVAAGFANHQRFRKSAEGAVSFFLPVSIRGEMPGRAMRGSAT